MLEYTREPFFDLHGVFVRQLRRTNRVVICGYGFGDKGVNRFLLEWMARDRGNLMVVVDPGAESIPDRARGAIAGRWRKWLQAERAKTLSRALAEVSWADIDSLL